MMKFFEIAVADRGLKTHQTLTYSHDEEIAVGTVARVEVRKRLKNGVVVASVEEPKYKTKPLTKVLGERVVPAHLLELAKWMADHYAVDLGTAIGLIIPQGAEKKRRSETVPDNPSSTKQAFTLNKQQKEAVETINKKSSSYLVRGVTGSGKTRVYIELIKRARKAKKGAVVLVPEIGLTSQMVDEVLQYIPQDVFVIHSNQTEPERHTQWLAIQACEAPVVIGPRSALFSPIQNLGLIVIDEEHETSYKQDVSPKYHAVRVASMLRKLTDATLVLGSATPNIEDYFRAERIPDAIITMPKPVHDIHTTTVDVVDIKKRDQFSSDYWLSDPLIATMKQTINAKNQVILFHNRRGTSTSVICQDCGWVAACPNCELPLTHHADWGELVCHVCNYREAVRSNCPDCKSADLVYKGAGTKEIVTATKKHFPDATIERFDSDISDKDAKLEQRYEALVNGEADIIIGTQMVAKGLDLPKLGLVGIILADTALYLPDYSSNERTYQLITQVVGRSGRHQDGRVILQSYHPDNPAIQYAIARDWDGFYAAELADRSIAKYPPHVFMLKLTIEQKQDSEARQHADEFAKALRSGMSDISVLGPTPSFHHKTRSGWRWQIVVKSTNRNKLTHIAKQLPPKWQFELDPINLL